MDLLMVKALRMTTTGFKQPGDRDLGCFRQSSSGADTAPFVEMVNLWGSDSPKLASSVTASGGLKISDFQGEDTLVIPRSLLRGRSFFHHKTKNFHSCFQQVRERKHTNYLSFHRNI
jgi:hypothetical protein